MPRVKKINDHQPLIKHVNRIQHIGKRKLKLSNLEIPARIQSVCNKFKNTSEQYKSTFHQLSDRIPQTVPSSIRFCLDKTYKILPLKKGRSGAR